MSRDIKITGKVDASRIIEVLISSGSTGQAAFFSGLQQAVENSIDAGASRFDIIFDKKAKTLILSDNGQGFGQNELEAFYSLYISSKTGLEGLIGKNGSGRIFLLQIAKKVNAFSVSTAFPNMINFSLTREDLVHLVSEGNARHTPISVNPPTWWKNRKTGTDLELQDVEWSRVPSENKIRQDFASYLRPSISRMVFVNGKPLQPRPVVGEVIEQNFRVSGFKEPIEVELFLPEKGKAGDEVRLGAYNPIIGLREFARVSPLSIPSELLGGGVCGDIFIPDMNPYRAHDGRSLEDRFYQSNMLENLCLFLNKEVAPIIKAAFARKQSENERAQKEEALSELSQTLRRAFGTPKSDVPGDNPGKNPGSIKKVQNNLSLTPSRVNMFPEEAIEIKVTGAIAHNGSFLWELDGEGVLSSTTGSNVFYTAGQIGKSTIRVTEKKSNRTGKVSIRVVATDEVMITPSFAEIEAGNRQTFRIKTKRPNFIPEWQFSLTGNDYEIVSPNQISVKTHQIGEHYLNVAGGDGVILATARLIVKHPSHEMNNIISIEGCDYLLDLAILPVGTIVEHIPGGKIDPRQGGGKIDVLQVDVDHDVIRQTRHLTSSTDANLNAMLPYLLGAHVRSQAEKAGEFLSAVDYTQRVADLQAKTLKARSKSTRKR